MLRSMYSGISGMRNFQTKLDVIGNNIANVNTFGFKKGRVVFQDMMSQSVAGASAPTANRGGVNPKQVGLGSVISTIDTIHTAGSSQFTGRTLDLAIEGDGFFVVGDVPDIPRTGSTASVSGAGDYSYTRAGNLYLDNQGYLVNSDGLYVLGSFVPNANPLLNDSPAQNGNSTITGASKIKIPTDAKDISIGPDGTITYIASSGHITPAGDNAVKAYNDAKKTLAEKEKALTEALTGTDQTKIDAAKAAVETAKADLGTKEAAAAPYLLSGKLITAGQLVIAKFPNTGGLQKTGSNLFKPTTNSGDVIFNYATESGNGTIKASTLEMSNVDLSEEFTEMIVAQRGFQANTRIITTSDEILQELVNLKR